MFEVIFEEVKVESLMDRELEFEYLMKEVPEESVKLLMFRFVVSAFLESYEIEMKVEFVNVESTTLFKVKLTVKVGSVASGAIVTS